MIKAYYQEFADNLGELYRIEFLPCFEGELTVETLGETRTWSKLKEKMITVDLSLDYGFQDALIRGLEISPVMKLKIRINNDIINSELTESILKAQSSIVHDLTKFPLALLPSTLLKVSAYVPNVWRLKRKINDVWTTVFTGVQNLPKSKKLKKKIGGLEYEIECTSFFRWVAGTIPISYLMEPAKIYGSNLPILSNDCICSETTSLDLYEFTTNATTTKVRFYSNSITCFIKLNKMLSEFQTFYSIYYQNIIREPMTGGILPNIFDYVPGITFQDETDDDGYRRTTSTTKFINSFDLYVPAYIYDKSINEYVTLNDFISIKHKTVWDFMTNWARQHAIPLIYNETTQNVEIPPRFEEIQALNVEAKFDELEQGYNSVDRVEISTPYGSGTLSKVIKETGINLNVVTGACESLFNNIRTNCPNNDSLLRLSGKISGTAQIEGGSLYFWKPTATFGNYYLAMNKIGGYSNGDKELMPPTTTDNNLPVNYYNYIVESIPHCINAYDAQRFLDDFGKTKQSYLEIETNSKYLKENYLGAKIQLDFVKILGFDINKICNNIGWVTGITCDNIKEGVYKLKIFLKG